MKLARGAALGRTARIDRSVIMLAEVGQNFSGQWFVIVRGAVVPCKNKATADDTARRVNSGELSVSTILTWAR